MRQFVSMPLADLLTMDDVVLGLRAPDVGAAAAQLMRQTLPPHGYSARDVDRVVRAVIARESEVSTMCGAIAIPHARDPQLTSFVASIGINAEGVVAGSPVPRVIVAFVSPEQQRTEHLALLAEISRLSRNAAAIEAIVAATTAEDVLAAIRRVG